MSARKIGGYAEAAGRQPDAQASRRSDRSQVITPAQATDPRTPPAFILQARTTGHSTPLARCYSALTRTRHWPTPEVKPRIPMANDARGSRAATDPGTPPDLLNPSKGLSMAKTACVSLQAALKFVPVPDLMKPAQISQTVRCRPSERRMYTLCEVYNGERQLLPVWLLEQQQPANQEPIKTITYIELIN
ncbi:MAG: hypothetical protein Q8L38_05530 [Pseudohongiella sp.]|nr:hypothetical protein [Pseudohongiella sp.]